MYVSVANILFQSDSEKNKIKLTLTFFYNRINVFGVERRDYWFHGFSPETYLG